MAVVMLVAQTSGLTLTLAGQFACTHAWIRPGAALLDTAAAVHAFLRIVVHPHGLPLPPSSMFTIPPPSFLPPIRSIHFFPPPPAEFLISCVACCRHRQGYSADRGVHPRLRIAHHVHTGACEWLCERTHTLAHIRSSCLAGERVRLTHSRTRSASNRRLTRIDSRRCSGTWSLCTA